MFLAELSNWVCIPYYYQYYIYLRLKFPKVTYIIFIVLTVLPSITWNRISVKMKTTTKKTSKVISISVPIKKLKQTAPSASLNQTFRCPIATKAKILTELTSLTKRSSFSISFSSNWWNLLSSPDTFTRTNWRVSADKLFDGLVFRVGDETRK